MRAALRRAARRRSSSESIDAALTGALDGDEGDRVFERGDLADAFQGGSVRSRPLCGRASPPTRRSRPLTATARLDRRPARNLGADPGARPRPRRGRARRRPRRGPGDALPDPGRRRLRPQARDEGDRAGGDPRGADRSGRCSSPGRALEEIERDTFRPAGAGADDRPGSARAASMLGWQARIAAPDDRRRRSRRGSAAAARLIAADRRPRSRARCRLTPSRRSRSTICRPRSASPTGGWRSGAHSYTAFFTESFIDELARLAGRRAARPSGCRCSATIRGSPAAWPPPPRSAAGTAARRAAAWASPATAPSARHIAALVEVEVDRATSGCACSARCARSIAGGSINPEIVKQQIEGGLIFGIAAATGNPIGFERRPARRARLRRFRLPDARRLARGQRRAARERGGAGRSHRARRAGRRAGHRQRLHALTGRRLRALPLRVGG